MLSNMTNLTSINGGNQTLINNPDLCTLETCDLSLSSLNYIPTLSGNALFLGIFSLILILQLGLGLCYQTWGFTIAMCLGLVSRDSIICMMSRYSWLIF